MGLITLITSIRSGFSILLPFSPSDLSSQRPDYYLGLGVEMGCSCLLPALACQSLGSLSILHRYPESTACPPYASPAIVSVPDVLWLYLPIPGLSQAAVYPALLISHRQGGTPGWKWTGGIGGMSHIGPYDSHGYFSSVNKGLATFLGFIPRTKEKVFPLWNSP